jgi:hypothetical protein
LSPFDANPAAARPPGFARQFILMLAASITGFQWAADRQAERVAVRLGLGDLVGAEIADRARLVLRPRSSGRSSERAAYTHEARRSTVWTHFNNE